MNTEMPILKSESYNTVNMITHEFYIKSLKLVNFDQVFVTSINDNTFQIKILNENGETVVDFLVETKPFSDLKFTVNAYKIIVTLTKKLDSITVEPLNTVLPSAYTSSKDWSKKIVVESDKEKKTREEKENEAKWKKLYHHSAPREKRILEKMFKKSEDGSLQKEMEEKKREREDKKKEMEDKRKKGDEQRVFAEKMNELVMNSDKRDFLMDVMRKRGMDKEVNDREQREFDNEMKRLIEGSKDKKEIIKMMKKNAEGEMGENGVRKMDERRRLAEKMEELVRGSSMMEFLGDVMKRRNSGEYVSDEDQGRFEGEMRRLMFESKDRDEIMGLMQRNREMDEKEEEEQIKNVEVGKKDDQLNVKENGKGKKDKKDKINKEELREKRKMMKMMEENGSGDMNVGPMKIGKGRSGVSNYELMKRRLNKVYLLYFMKYKNEILF